jgi:hypothetical protein
MRLRTLVFALSLIPGLAAAQGADPLASQPVLRGEPSAAFLTREFGRFVEVFLQQ